MEEMKMNETNEFNNGYVDPIANQNGGTAKKKMGKADIAATIVAFLLVKLFGFLGALICYGGYWAVRGIAKSRMPLVVRIILGIVVAVVFVVLLIFLILLASSLTYGA